MKTRLFAISSFLLLTACVQARQEPNSVLHSAQLSPSSAAVKEQSFKSTLQVGPEKEVPVQVEWSVAPDKEGCLRVVKIDVRRLGGPSDLIIENVKPSTVSDCAMAFDSQDPTRYQVLLLSLDYKASRSGKQFNFSGSVATLQGNGKFTPT